MTIPEKLLFACQNAAPFRPRVCYGITLAGDQAVTAEARRSSVGIVRQAVAAPGAKTSRGALTSGCLAVHESLTLWLNSPLVSRAKAEKVLPALLDIQLPFPLEDCLYQFVEFRRTPDGKVSALVCAARREAIQTCLERYRARGIDPMLLDHEGLALWTQSLIECPPVPQRRPEQHRALIYLDHDHATLVIGCGNRYANAHSLKITGTTMDDRLVNRMQLVLHADLPAGVNVQWLFCNAAGGQAAIAETLHRSLTATWPGSLTPIKAPATFLARALCTRAVKRGPLRCNLRRQSFTHPAVQRAAAGRARAAAVGIMIAGILLVGFSLTSRFWGMQQFNRIKSEIATMAAELAPGVHVQYGREIPEVQRAWEQRAPQTAPFLDAFTPSLAKRLAEIIRAGQAAAVHFETLNLKYNSLVLTGVAEDWDQCATLEQNLKALGYTVKMDRQEAVAEAEVRFTINAKGGGP